MLGKNPLYVTLRKYRVIHIIVTVFLLYLTWDVWLFTKLSLATLSDWQVVPVSSAFLSLIAGLFAISKDAINKQERDDHDN